jgi:hypothetical protein
VFTLGFLPGFLRARVPPTRWLDSHLVEHKLAPTGRHVATPAPPAAAAPQTV